MKHILILLSLLTLSINLFSQSYKHLGEFYAKKEYSKVIKQGQKLLKEDPNNTELNMLIGRSYVAIGRHQQSIPFLKKGAIKENSKDWIEAWSLAHLGISYFYTNNHEKAKQCLNQAILLNATKNVNKFAKGAIQMLQLDEYYSDWKIIDTEYIKFHFSSDLKFLNIEKYAKLRVNAYVEINEFFNAKPLKKIDFYVWNDRNIAKEKLGRELGFASSRTCVINADYRQTRGHEITHILLAFGISPTHRTKFINEGVAVFFDQTNKNRLETAKNDINKSKLDIINLWKNPDKYPNSYNYSVGGAFIEFLTKHGNESQLKKLLKEQTVENAKKVYDNFEELIKEFEKELKI